jgi:hypothetical protein
MARAKFDKSTVSPSLDEAGAQLDAQRFAPNSEVMAETGFATDIPLVPAQVIVKAVAPKNSAPEVYVRRARVLLSHTVGIRGSKIKMHPGTVL